MREGWSWGQLEKYRGKAIFNDAFSSKRDPCRNNLLPDAKIAISRNVSKLRNGLNLLSKFQ